MGDTKTEVRRLRKSAGLTQEEASADGGSWQCVARVVQRIEAL
jgi:hypothetical protein